LSTVLCDAVSQCMAPSDAVTRWGSAGYTQTSSLACGYLTGFTGDVSISTPEYCFIQTPGSGKVVSGVTGITMPTTTLQVPVQPIKKGGDTTDTEQRIRTGVTPDSGQIAGKGLPAFLVTPDTSRIPENQLQNPDANISPLQGDTSSVHLPTDLQTRNLLAAVIMGIVVIGGIAGYYLAPNCNPRATCKKYVLSNCQNIHERISNFLTGSPRSAPVQAKGLTAKEASAIRLSERLPIISQSTGGDCSNRISRILNFFSRR
jgi:hypothetical protein